MLFVYVPSATAREAQKIGHKLLAKKLIACFNTWPSASGYIWRRKQTASREVILLLKTIERNEIRVKRVIEALHSYKAPCVASINVKQLNKAYDKWCQGRCS